MPILRTSGQLIFFAHVPKCAGSAVEAYLQARFGPLALLDNAYMRHDASRRWSRSSPQHIDLESLGRLFPSGFFDYSFAVVRHPVARIVSAYHFQREVEGTLPEDLSLTDWLHQLQDGARETSYQYDNHTRPMADLVPEDARIFHLEHGLDPIIPWLDAITGTSTAPRAFTHKNKRGDHVRNAAKAAKETLVPDAQALALIAKLYARDFTRFGYDIATPAPRATAPTLSARFKAQRDAELQTRNRLSQKILRKTHRILARLRQEKQICSK